MTMADPVVRLWPDLLVPFDASRGAEKVLRRACRVARREGDRLTVLCVAKLPPDCYDEVGDPEVEFDAMLALTRAQQICQEEGIIAAFNLSHSRDLADGIVAEARRSHAILICMSLDEYDAHELGETALMSATVQSVLAAAPCSVLVDDPEAELQQEVSSQGSPA